MKISFKDIYENSIVAEWVKTINVRAISSKCTNKKYIKAICNSMNISSKGDISVLSIVHLNDIVEKKGAQPTFVNLVSEICKNDVDFSKLKEKGWLFDDESLNGKDKTRYESIGRDNYRVYKDAEVPVLMIRAIRVLLDINGDERLGEYFFEYDLKEKQDNTEANDMKTESGDNATNTSEKNTLSIEEILNGINNYINSKGFLYDSNLIENFYLSLKAKPFVILAGISGTGKTKLVELFAEAIGATSKNGRYLLVPVRPDWSDSTDLLGHMNLSGEFVPGAIVDFVYEANKNLDKPYFLCLDEMNLARVEYYLSDILSVIETRKIRENGRIASLPLFTKDTFSDDTKIVGTDLSAKMKYANICLSENLYIIGTVNMDETTFPFSKKVLDRANTIEFSKIDTLIPDFEKIFNAKLESAGTFIDISNEFLRAKYTKIEECNEVKDTVIADCIILQELNAILEKAEAHVGFRVRDEIVFYLLYSREIDGGKNINIAFDNEIMQKILPRIQGSGMKMVALIESLIDFCGNKYPKSKAKLAAMKERCGEYGEGYTSYWL